MPLSLAALLPALAAFFCGPASAADAPPAHYEVLAGSCAGRGRPPEPPVISGPAYDLRRAPMSSDELNVWGLLGYREDAKTGRLLGPDGRSAPEGEIARMRQAFDASAEEIDVNIWGDLQHRGTRLDEATCRLYDPEGREITRLEIAGTAALYKKSFEHSALANLNIRLKGLDPKAPVPKSMAKEMLELDKAGVKLPASIRNLMFSPRPPLAGDIAKQADSEYLNSTRYFDGRNTLPDLMRSALPLVPGLNEPPRDPTYVVPEEKRLGERLSADLRERFSKTDAGRELLDRFRDKKGVVRLPDVQVLKLSQRPDDPRRPGAQMHPTNGSITLNHWEAVSHLLAVLPPEERARRAREFADAGALRRYLLENPKERALLLDTLDQDFYHELVHSWQLRRDRFMVEEMRGNLPGANALADEHEAHREECRYFFSKAMLEPDLIRRSPFADTCLPLLRDYETFKDGITRQYMSTYAGSQKLADIRKLQEARTSTARRLAGEGLRQKLVQKLKLLGFARGDKTLKEHSRNADSRELEFENRKLPRLRAEAAGALPGHFEKAGRPDVALRVLDAIPPDEDGDEEEAKAREESLDSLQRKTITLLLKPASGLSLDERLWAFYSVTRRIDRARKPWPAGLAAAYRRDKRLKAQEFLAAADSAGEASARAQLMADARAWGQKLEPNDPLRRRLFGTKGKK